MWDTVTHLTSELVLHNRELLENKVILPSPPFWGWDSAKSVLFQNREESASKDAWSANREKIFDRAAAYVQTLNKVTQLQLLRWFPL